MLPTTRANYTVAWKSPSTIPATDFECAYCGREVASRLGWIGEGQNLSPKGRVNSTDGGSDFRIGICPRCGNPTYIADGRQVPGRPFGEHVEYLPDDVGRLYEETRRCMGESAYNAAVMVGRKLLMSVAAARGAKPGETFKAYVDFLEKQHIVTPDMKSWVDEIRELGNDANHELPHVTPDQAEALVTFVAMLLKIVYEYPERGRQSVAARAARVQAT